MWLQDRISYAYIPTTYIFYRTSHRTKWESFISHCEYKRNLVSGILPTFFQVYMVSYHDKQKPTVGYILTATLSSFVPFCFIFFNSSFLSSTMFSNVSYDLSCLNTHPYFVTLLLSLRVPIHSTPLFVIYFVRL